MIRSNFCFFFIWQQKKSLKITIDTLWFGSKNEKEPFYTKVEFVFFFKKKKIEDMLHCMNYIVRHCVNNNSHFSTQS